MEVSSAINVKSATTSDLSGESPVFLGDESARRVGKAAAGKSDVRRTRKRSGRDLSQWK